jgi:predicted membrane protein
VRLASSFLTTSLVFVAVGLGLSAYFFSQDQLNFHDFSQSQVSTKEKFLIFSLGISALAAGIASGIATYFLLKRKHNEELKGVSSLVSEMKNKMGQRYDKQTNGVEGITADALTLADKIMTLLPELVRKRNQDALLFGAVAFIIANIVGHNAAAAVIVGVIVWLFFRYEAKKARESEMSKLEEQKKVFEQRKRDFLDSL